MIVLKTRRWISDDAFKEILRIAEYSGVENGEKRFALNVEKAVRNGYDYQDVIELIKEHQLEVEGSIEDLKKAFEAYAPLVEWDSVTGYVKLHVPWPVFNKVRPVLGEAGARRASSSDAGIVYRIPPYKLAIVHSKLSSLGVELRDPGRLLEDKLLPLKPELSKISLREYQLEALDKWRSNNHQGIVALPTGSGKTLIGVAAIASTGRRSLVITFTREQMFQWRDAILKATNIPSSMIGVIYSEEKRLAPITITTYQSGFRIINELSPLFDLLIVDEVHHLPADKFKHIAVHSIAKYRLGLSATPYREDGRHEELFPLLGGIIYHKTPAELSVMGYLARYRVYTVKVRLKGEELEQYNSLRRLYFKLANGRDFKKVLEDAMRGDPRAKEALKIHSQMRMMLAKSEAKIDKAVEIALDELKKGGKIIVFTQYVEQAEELSKRLGAYLLTGEVPPLERKRILEEFKASPKGILVVTTVGDEGLDIPDANVGVMVSGTGSRRQFIQRLGRLLRPKPGGEEARLYEIVLEKTPEEYQSRKRKTSALDLGEDDFAS
ncbi:MAG: DEAD/DEAH box helicase [Thermosphaera sp.]